MYYQSYIYCIHVYMRAVFGTIRALSIPTQYVYLYYMYVYVYIYRYIDIADDVTHKVSSLCDVLHFALAAGDLQVRLTSALLRALRLRKTSGRWFQ